MSRTEVMMCIRHKRICKLHPADISSILSRDGYNLSSPWYLGLGQYKDDRSGLITLIVMPLTIRLLPYIPGGGFLFTAWDTWSLGTWEGKLRVTEHWNGLCCIVNILLKRLIWVYNWFQTSCSVLLFWHNSDATLIQRIYQALLCVSQCWTQVTQPGTKSHPVPCLQGSIV